MSQRMQQKVLHISKHEARIDPRILLLALGMFALGTDAFVIAGILPAIAHEMGITVNVTGQLVTVFSLTYGLGAPFLAALMSRWSPRYVLIAGLGFFCFANIGSALAPTFPLLIVTRILAGCFAAIYAPMAYTIGIELAPPEKRGRALALVVIGLTVATALGSPLGTWVGEHFGWRLSFGLVAALAGISFLALLIGGLPATAPPPAVALTQRLVSLTRPDMILALLPAFLWNMAVYGMYTYISPLVQSTLHMRDISELLAFFGLGIVVGNGAGGMLTDRFGSYRPLLISLTLLLAIEIIFPLTDTFWWGAAGNLLVIGFAASLATIPQQHRLLSIAPEHANVMLALNNSSVYLGIATGAALGGLTLHFVAITQLSWVSALYIVVSLILLVISVRQNKRRER